MTVASGETIRPDLEEVAAFLAVVEAQSFSEAGRRLGIDRSSVSRRVAQLEDKLGARLLHRTTRSLSLTEVGKLYHEHVGRAFAGLEEAADAVRELDRVPRGHLRITAPTDLGRLLSRLVTAFTQAHAEVSVEVMLTQRYVDLVGEAVDLALRAGRLPDSTLVARRIGTSALALFAHPAYLEAQGLPHAPNCLQRHPFVLFRSVGRQTLNLRHESGERCSVILEGTVSANEFGFVRDAVIAGAGLGMMPVWSAIDATERGELLRILPEWTAGPSPLHLVYPSARLLSAKVAAFRDFAVQWFEECRPSSA